MYECVKLRQFRVCSVITSIIIYIYIYIILYNYVVHLHHFPCDHLDFQHIVNRGQRCHVIDKVDCNVALILIGRHQHAIVHCLHVVV